MFAVQDEITTAVVTAIRRRSLMRNMRRVLRKPPENLGAWEAYQRGLWHVEKHNPPTIERAKQFFQQAIDLDADVRLGHTGLAMAYADDGAITYGTRPLEEVAKLPQIGHGRRSKSTRRCGCPGHLGLSAMSMAGNRAMRAIRSCHWH